MICSVKVIPMAKSFQNMPDQKSAPSNAAQAQAMLQQACAFHQKGQLAQAQALYEGFLKAQPRHFDALHLFGCLAFQTKRYEMAIELISKAIEIKSTVAAPYSNIGMAFYALNRWNEALVSYDKAIAFKPDYAEAYFNRGNALKALMRLDEALASYDKAIALVPFYFQAYNNRGITLNDLNRSNEALISYDRAIALNSNYFEAYINRGETLLHLQRLHEAVANYDKALSLKSDYVEAYLNRGNALTLLKRLDEALVNYDKALSLKPDYAEAYYNRANALRELQRLDEAQSDYEQVVALQPNNQDAQYAVASLTKKNIPNIAPRQYVVNLFDECAERFDDILVNTLEYQTPVVLATQFGRHIKEGCYDILDLGCGTGLSGKAFYDYVQRLVGVDLSPRMLEKAKQREIYDELVCADIMEFLQGNKETTDLVVSADVLIYIGELSALFKGVKGVLRNGGWFSFSVESCDGDGFELKSSQRYGHSLPYVESIAESFGFIVKEVLSTNLRKEREEYLPGYAFLLYKP